MKSDNLIIFACLLLLPFNEGIAQINKGVFILGARMAYDREELSAVVATDISAPNQPDRIASNTKASLNAGYFVTQNIVVGINYSFSKNRLRSDITVTEPPANSGFTSHNLSTDFDNRTFQHVLGIYLGRLVPLTKRLSFYPKLGFYHQWNISKNTNQGYIDANGQSVNIGQTIIDPSTGEVTFIGMEDVEWGTIETTSKSYYFGVELSGAFWLRVSDWLNLQLQFINGGYRNNYKNDLVPQLFGTIVTKEQWAVNISPDNWQFGLAFIF